MKVKKRINADFKVEEWVGSSTVKGTGRRFPTTIIEHDGIYASKLGNERKVWVYLPPSYFKSRKRYPVLYAHDGNNLFYPSTAFNGIDWALDQTTERLIKNGEIEEIIIVAISNTPYRDDEYTPKFDIYEGYGGKAHLYADFLINELIPFINHKYRTFHNAGNTALLGSSFGGLVSLYIGWNYPRYFSMIGAMSPSIWWADRDILNMIMAGSLHPPHLKIWIDMGTDEGDDYEEGEEDIRDARDLLDTLLNLGYTLGKNVGYFEDIGARHSEAAWRARVHRVLRFFFSKKEHW